MLPLQIPVYHFFLFLKFWVWSVDETSIFTITQYNGGTFTANFKEDPPPIPQEYLLGIYTLSATVFTGWFVPNIARWLNSRFQQRHMTNFLLVIQNHEKGYIEIEELKTQITYAYAKGKISESHYKILNEKIDSIDSGK